MGAKQMAKKHYLVKRNGIYYFRMRVPQELRSAYSKTHIQRSLATRSLNAACRARDAFIVAYHAEFDELRRHRDPQCANKQEIPPFPTNAQLERSLQNWLQTELQRVATEGDPFRLGDEEDRDERIRELETDLAALGKDAETVERWISAVANEVLLRTEVPRAKVISEEFDLEKTLADVDYTSSGYATFRAAVKIALYEIAKAEIARLRGEGFSLSAGVPQIMAKAKPTLREVIQEFEADPKRRGAGDKTHLDYRTVFRVLSEHVGLDKPIDEISREDCKQVRDLLLASPPNATKRFPNLTLRQAANEVADNGDDRLATKTVNLLLSKINTIFRWAEAEGYIDRNPAKGLRVGASKTHSRFDRNPFSIDQLNKIFQAPIYSGCIDDERHYALPGPNRPKRTRFWVPLIALFHGMRLNEICQLRVDDVVEIGTNLCFRLDVIDDDQRLKTEASRRIVPVHPTLIGIGFKAFLDRVRAENDRLFPDLGLDSRGYRSDGFQKWFRRFLEKTDAYTEKTTFHSFRHNWRDAARNARIPEEIIEALGGWSNQKISSNYGLGYAAETLFQEIAKINFANLDLSHLEYTT